MSQSPLSRLYLISPLLTDAETFAPILDAACKAGDVAAVLLRLPAVDPRQQVNILKSLAPIAQAHGVAAVATADEIGELATIAMRGGADGVHVAAPSETLAELRRQIGTERILGVGGLRLKDNAMRAGEAGADYLLFGEPKSDGFVPDLTETIERAAWWAEIFETPCVAYAPALDAIAALAATRVEFIALGETVWNNPEGAPQAITHALTILSNSTVAG